MPSSDTKHGYPIPFASFRRSVLSTRPDQIHPKTPLDSFQQQVFTRFDHLSSVEPNEFLSIPWILKLLDSFAACLEDFRAMLSDHRAFLSKPPTDRLTSEYFDRALKAMDIFNSARNGVESIRLWRKHSEIIVSAIDIDSSKRRTISEGQFRRAQKALMDLALVMIDEKDSVFSNRGKSKGSSGHSRSLSWSASHNWSASKQLQLIAYNLLPPRPNDIASTKGLAMPIFCMSFVLTFVSWVLVAAVPCQDRSVQVPFAVPRQFFWSAPFFLIQNRIVEESKKKDRRNSCGLLREIYRIEKCVHLMTELIDNTEFPLSEEVKGEVRDNVGELSLVCEDCKTYLDPLERKLRETFKKVTSCRAEGIEFLGKGAEA